MPYWLRALLFVTAVLVLTFGTALHVHRALTRAFALSPRGERVLALLLASGPAFLLASRRAETWVGAQSAGALGVAGSILALATLASSVLLGLAHVASWLAERSRRTGVEPAPVSVDAADGLGSAPVQEGSAVGAPPARLTLGRRDLARRVAVGMPVAAAVGVSAYGAIFGRYEYAVEEITVPIDGLPRALDGYRIAQLSDLHFGVFCGAPERRAAVDLVRRARPDLVVLTGDLVDNHVAHTAEVGRLVRELVALAPRDGVVAIGGNHDYYAGLDDVLEAVRRAGARTLRNDGVLVCERHVALLGLDDVWGARYGWGPGPDLGAAIASVPSDLPRIVLSHNPVTFPENACEVALQLSGHTHGGQIAVAGYPAGAIFSYVRGLYRERGSYLYVNRGFGVAGPAARLGAAPELTIVTLRS